MSDLATQSRLRESIQALGLTDKAFAEAGGITRQTLAGYLNTDREPSRDTLAAWVKAYNLNAHWLLTGEGEMLADHQNPPLHPPLAQRVVQVIRLMTDSGVDELEVLRAVRSMVDGEIDKLAQRRGGNGASTPLGGACRAEEESSPASATRMAAGDDSE